MSIKKRFISLFFSLCIVATFISQSVHIYSHLLTEHFGIETLHSHKDKATHQHADDCKICHFNISPFTTMSFDSVEFFADITYLKNGSIYHFDFVEIPFNYFSLRAPPVYV